MEENEKFNPDFNKEDITTSEWFWNYMEDYWHKNREFPESVENHLNRKADLIDGKVPSSQLPSYVDDVLEFNAFENLPVSGEKGKIYLVRNNNTQFRWSGSEYIQINSDENLMTIDTVQDITGHKQFNSGLSLGSNQRMYIKTASGVAHYVTNFADDLDGFAVSTGFAVKPYNDTASNWLLVNGAGAYSNGQLLSTQTWANSAFHKKDQTGGINNGSDGRTNTSWFDYNWAGKNAAGSVINFSGFEGYSTELFSSYNAPNLIGIRSRQGDAGVWNEPRWIWHDKNFNPADYYKINLGHGISNQSELKPNGLQWTSTGNSESNFDGDLANKTIEGTFASFNGYSNEHKQLGFTLAGATSTNHGIYYKTWYGGAETQFRKLWDSNDFNPGNFAKSSQLGDYWKKEDVIGYIGINATNPFSVLNNGSAQKIYSGGLLVSNAYQDEDNIPTNGAYIKGTILTGSHGTSQQWKLGFEYGNHKAINDHQYLGSDYVDGGNEKPNSNYFGAGKLKLQMLSGGNLGLSDIWNDVLWMSSYTGADVKMSTAIVSSKYSNKIGFVKQDFDAQNWGTYYEFWTSENFNPANYSEVLPNSGNWNNNPIITDRKTTGELAWKNYGNGHTIFDISSGVTPWGDTKSNTDAQQPWSPSFPTLVGGNGLGTYGVRVDSARVADNTERLGGILASNYTQAWENVKAIGFNNGNSSDNPYIYHNTDGYIFLATQAQRFKNLRFTSDLDSVEESGIYRQESPSSGFAYTTTLNLNSSDGRQQLSIERGGSGMKFRGSTHSSDLNWSSWRTVWDDNNLVNPATQSWVESQDYATHSFVEESLNKIASEHIDPDYSISARSNLNTIILTDQFPIQFLELESELIPGKQMTIINTASFDIEVRKDGNIIDIVRSAETNEYYITHQHRLVRKGGYRNAKFLS